MYNVSSDVPNSPAQNPQKNNNNRIVLRFGVKRQRMCQVLNWEGVSPVARIDKRVIEIYMCMHY